MSRRTRRITRCVTVTVTVAFAAGALSACEPSHEVTRGIVRHKEYIPASVETVEDCSGTVPVVCNSGEVLQEQCWRLDLEDRYDFTGELRKQAERRNKPPHWSEYRKVCVFPSEFEKLNVGDIFIEDDIKY